MSYVCGIAMLGGAVDVVSGVGYWKGGAGDGVDEGHVGGFVVGFEGGGGDGGVAVEDEEDGVGHFFFFWSGRVVWDGKDTVDRGLSSFVEE